MLDVQLAANHLNLHVEESLPFPFVRKPNGDRVTSFAEPAGFAPVDLVQKHIVYSCPWIIGKFTGQKKSEHGFALLDLDAADGTAKVIRFTYPEDSIFPFICLAGPKVAHPDIALSWAGTGMKPGLEIDAQDLVGNFPSIDFLGAIHPDASSRAGIDVDGRDPRDLRDTLFLGQGEDDLFLSLGQLARPIVPLDPAGFRYEGRSFLCLLCTWQGDGVQLNQTSKRE